MAANPVNPGPSAGASPSPAAPSSPAPASAPAAPATPAPVSTPSAPAAPDTSKPTGNAVLDKITKSWSELPAVGEDEPTAVSDDAPPADAPPVDPVEAVEDADKPPTDPEAAAPADPAVPELILDVPEVFGPKEFNEFIAGNEALKQALDTNPAQKNAIYAALRRNEENKAIAAHGIFPTNAATIAKAAATFQGIDNKFLSGAKDDGSANPEGIQSFLNSWVQEAMFTDDKGAPVMENGKYKLHPALTHTLNHIYSNQLAVNLSSLEKTGKLTPELAEGFGKVLTYFEQQAKASGDDRHEAGLAIAREVFNSLSSPASGELPDQLKPLADSLKADRAALDNEKQTAERQRQESRQAAFTQSIDASDKKASDNFMAQLKPQFTKAGLTEFEANAAQAEIGRLMDEKLSANGLYQSLRDSLEMQLRSDPGNENLHTELTKLSLMYGQEYLGPIAAQVIRTAKGGALNRQSARETKVDAQKVASAADPKGVSIVPSAPQQMSPKDLGAQIVKEYMDSHNGDRPSTEYIIAERMKRTAAAQKKAS